MRQRSHASMEDLRLGPSTSFQSLFQGPVTAMKNQVQMNWATLQKSGQILHTHRMNQQQAAPGMDTPQVSPAVPKTDGLPMHRAGVTNMQTQKFQDVPWPVQDELQPGKPADDRWHPPQCWGRSPHSSHHYLWWALTFCLKYRNLYFSRPFCDSWTLIFT